MIPGRHSFLVLTTALAAVAVASGQAPSSAKKAAASKTAPPADKKAPAADKNWTVPRTPDGQPDFQGNYATATITPLERPAQFAGKEFLTEQEAAEYERKTLEQVNSDRRDGTAAADLSRNYNEFWRDRGTTLTAGRRTSLIVDPPDGKVPPLTPEARQRRAANSQRERLPSGPEDLHVRIRCITRGLPMVPTPNNNFFQFIQSPGYVVILQEMMYEARIIPLDGRRHIKKKILSYLGDTNSH